MMNFNAEARRAAWDIFRALGDEFTGSYTAPGNCTAGPLLLIVSRNQEVPTEDGYAVSQQTIIYAMAEQLPKVQRDGVFQVGCERWRVMKPGDADKWVVSAQVQPA